MTFSDFVPPVISNLWKPKQEGNNWWYRFWSSKTDVWNAVELLKAWEDIPELSAVIGMKGRMSANAIFKSIDKDGNDTIIPESKVLLDLLESPNWFQGRGEFIEQTKIFRELFGNEFLYFQKAFAIDKSQQIFTLPMNIVKAEYESKVPFFEQFDSSQVKYKYRKENGSYAELNSDQVIHTNDNRVNIKSPTDKNLIIGESKYAGLKAVLNNIRNAYESRGVIIKRRGALGILSNDGKDAGGTIPLDEKDVEQVQEKYRRYGGMEDQDQLIISPAALKWQQMAVNPDKLGLFQEIEESFNKILDTAGMASEIFVRTKGSTYENQRQGEKGTYIRTIIPEANSWCSSINNRFLKGAPVKIVATYNHLPIFQEDLKLRGESLNTMVGALSSALADGAITIEQYQDELTKYGIQKLNQK